MLVSAPLAELILTPERVFALCSVLYFVLAADGPEPTGTEEEEKGGKEANGESYLCVLVGKLAYSVLSNVLETAVLLSAMIRKGGKAWEVFVLNVLFNCLFSSFSLLCSS